MQSIALIEVSGIKNRISVSWVNGLGVFCSRVAELLLVSSASLLELVEPFDVELPDFSFFISFYRLSIRVSCSRMALMNTGIIIS